MTRERTDWHVTNSNGLFEVADEDGAKVAYIAAGETAFDRARLIAAAPDLLNALVRLRNEAVLDGLSSKPGWDSFVSQADEAIIRAGRTALSGQT